jgi:subtilase family serine protease
VPMAPVTAQSTANVARVCGDTTQENQCLALRRTDVDGGEFSLTHAAAQDASATPSGYGPVQLRAAYDLPSTEGSGQTIALIEVGDYPNAASDLAVYRAKYGLTACTAANGCFKKVGQTGGALPAENAGWAQETALDEDVVSAICPKCHILIIEVSSSTNADVDTAENEAATLGATEISNSFGGSETLENNPAFDHPGIIITASSGDVAGLVQQPCSFVSVVCVGGTTLTTAHNARGWTETAWPDAGGGCSKFVLKPEWQNAECRRRIAPDVAFDANPTPGIAVYDSVSYDGSSGWMAFGGTSVGAPAIAAVYALAGNARSLDAAESIWEKQKTSALNLVGGGFTDATGWGTPSGTSAF